MYRITSPSIQPLICLVLLIASIDCFYDVPSYYGHFSLDYFKVSNIRAGVFRYFEYHYAFDIDSENRTVYFANSKQNCIEKYDFVKKRKTVLAGICGTAGNRVGGLSVMLLNNPMSVVLY